jgi:hypothetical protein
MKPTDDATKLPRPMWATFFMVNIQLALQSARGPIVLDAELHGFDLAIAVEFQDQLPPRTCSSAG